MSLSHLSPEQAELAEQIFQSLRQAAEADLRGLAELLASKEDSQILGHTKFEVRDRVHKIGAKALETALEGRKKGATTAPAAPAPAAARRPSCRGGRPRRSSAPSGRCG